MWLRLKDVRSNWDAGWVSWYIRFARPRHYKDQFWNLWCLGKKLLERRPLNARLQHGRPVQEGYRLAAKDTHDQ